MTGTLLSWKPGSLVKAAVARAVSSTHVGKRVVAGINQGLLPLRAPEKELSESSLLAAAHGGATFLNLRRDFPAVPPRAGASSWVHLLVVLLNYMWLGWGPADKLESVAGARATPAQAQCLRYLRVQVDYFLRGDGVLQELVGRRSFRRRLATIRTSWF